ncbi:FAD/NAD(P)-binding domain-containing protein [Sodiomyces alkalinus F11]|uniref:FAD/NAD(P)-binding domain-containing protein n=1 Tax=Sodiomyces alkalinus (strain CBS 110278 / VKM F-3762 / F11) TaxID=1314773 RepID=A0A3N2PTN7_SODAK|nr:FAD/NAD(P)-binding domain-containing protein [Sodiomyces alkalinus F11]ROT37870.1 FAD/NAD(P)-binding domain-containing protein [Sodiomyces alkalinus F11]
MCTFCPVPTQQEYPRTVNLRKSLDEHPLPVIAPGTVDAASLTGEEPAQRASLVLAQLNAALTAQDAAAVERCFFPEQAYWKDNLALTYHLRTFITPRVVAAGLLETAKLRGVSGHLTLEGAVFIPATPALQFIDCALSFRTSSPAATCSGRLILLPVKGSSDEDLQWKIWVLSTKLENLDLQAEDESLLQAPRRHLDGLETFETDVFVIGAGNAAITLAARLKALGVDSVMAERNRHVGDNWALRYDSLKFHVVTSFCELPYLQYPKEVHSPHLLSRDDLAEQVRRYVTALNLNVITSANIQSTVYDPSTKRWTVKFQTPEGGRTAVAKHLVQASGVSSQKKYLPKMADEHLYKGTSFHSELYKNANELKERGIKSVLIVGSANTAFDVLQDCHAAGLASTIVVRSPTYIVPQSYVTDQRGLGIYDILPADQADRMFLTLPTFIDAAFARDMLAAWASAEPTRYDALAAAGFPVLDSRDKDCVLMENLIGRSGGHYVDVGGAKLIEDGEVGIKALVEPVAFTETGLRFSDGTTADADAVIWCTGYADRNLRDVAAEILGGGGGSDVSDSDNVGGDAGKGEGVLGPREIAARIDATWGVDAEGEIRGMWKRHLHMENYWVMGGYSQQHRWHSRTLALQIKAALEGVLPPAYRKTPAV